MATGNKAPILLIKEMNDKNRCTNELRDSSFSKRTEEKTGEMKNK